MNERDDDSGRPIGPDEWSGLKVLGVALLIVVAVVVLLAIAVAGSANFDLDIDCMGNC